jgi:hypothetical protein
MRVQPGPPRSATCAVRAQVYTFGAPRPGDANFARECNHLFPDMWHIINDAVRRPQPRWGAQGARRAALREARLLRAAAG